MNLAFCASFKIGDVDDANSLWTQDSICAFLKSVDADDAKSVVNIRSHGNSVRGLKNLPICPSRNNVNVDDPNSDMDKRSD